MNITDPIADLLTRIRNAQHAKHEVDRPIRPLFPKTFQCETMIQIMVMSYDRIRDSNTKLCLILVILGNR
jgi:formate/nitrite transporter FocA (FNT family)